MKNIFNALVLIVLTGSIVSCERGDDFPISDQEKQVNTFIWKGLNSWYYWQDDVSLLKRNYFWAKPIIYTQEPEPLFYSLLYNYETVDRFSWIVDDADALLAQFSGVSKSSGMDMSLYLKDSGNTNVVGIINYVVPDSPADLAGLERGDVISGVNGSNLTVSNYTSLFDDSFSITIAESVSASSSGIVTSGEAKNVTINAVVLEENPIAFSSVIEEGDKKIGYLVYNGFRSNYNDELNTAIGELKAAGITDLILDLRYNGGGSVDTAVGLGQMITGQFTGKPYVILDFNSKHDGYDYTATLSKSMTTYDADGNETGTQTINSLNLTKVYVLTSSGTASASELTISGLQPYIDVVTIGDETYGKFVGSITLFDSPNNDFTSYSARNTAHNWAMQPITFAYYNGVKDAHPTGGILPDYEIIPYQYFGTLAEFGNTSDPGLAKAINVITGVGKYKTDKVGFNRSKAFVGSKKTLSKFGTELYLENVSKK